jgi:inner membrane protein
MASAFTHAFVGTVIGKAFKAGRKMPARFWVGLAVCAAFPDVDVIGYWFGVPLDSPWGHRGFTHSILFAGVLAWVGIELLFRKEKRFSKSWWVLLVCFFIACVSHGMLDACTDGGHGITFFWPFDNTRYFFPFRPIAVSPLGISRFYGERGVRIIESELLWVWLPTILIYFIWRLGRGFVFRKKD